mgnify:FL=1
MIGYYSNLTKSKISVIYICIGRKFMFDINDFMHSGALAPAIEWKGYPKYNFIGGHNDNDSIPLEGLKKSIEQVITKEGKTLALSLIHI